MFFFEKKNQKSSAFWPHPRSDTAGTLRTWTGKRFLVLFFKKEQFFRWVRSGAARSTGWVGRLGMVMVGFAGR